MSQMPSWTRRKVSTAWCLVKSNDELTTCFTVDMELGDVILTEDFTLYDAMSALEAIRTRSHPRPLLMLVLFRSVTLVWTVGLSSMTRRSGLYSLHSPRSFQKKCVTYWTELLLARCAIADPILLLSNPTSCKMEWHVGYTLPQTIYTCLYVHHLTDIDPEATPHLEQLQRDPARPLELVTVVIRAAIMGFLKCCDLVWRELSKGKLHDVCDLAWSIPSHH